MCFDVEKKEVFFGNCRNIPLCSMAVMQETFDFKYQLDEKDDSIESGSLNPDVYLNTPDVFFPNFQASHALNLH